MAVTLTEFFKTSANRKISVAKRVLLSALGALANEQQVVEDLCAESILVDGASLHVSLVKDANASRAEAYVDPLPFEDHWFPNQFALGVAFHDALARGVGKADGYDVAVSIGTYVDGLQGPYSVAIAKMTSGDKKKRFQKPAEAIEFVKNISTVSVVRVLVLLFLVLAVGGSGVVAAMRWYAAKPQPAPAAQTVPPPPVIVPAPPTPVPGPPAGLVPTGPTGPKIEDRPVSLPDSLGGNITLAAMDALVKAAPGPAGFSVVMLDKKTPVYHLGDVLKAGYKCTLACRGVLYHRNAEGKYTRLSDVQLGANGIGHTDPLRLTPPIGKERFILIVSREALKPGDLDGNLDALKDKLSVSVAEYEIAEKERQN